MTPEELLNEMTYENESQKEEAKKYIALKGIVQYQHIIKFCHSHNEIPKYSKVSALYRYDKRLRDNIYIYLATVEEFLHACLGNKFENDESELVKTGQFLEKQKRYHSVSLTLEQLTLCDLIKIVLKNQGIFANHFDLNNIKMNLNALRVLRNKVCHHNFLLDETYATCVVNGKVNNSLEQNIKNLQNFLPFDFRQGFEITIKNCAKGLEVNQKIEIIGLTSE